MNQWSAIPWAGWIQQRRWSEDVIQETAARLIAKGFTECPIPLAHIVARHVTIDQVRRSKRARAVAVWHDERRRVGTARPEPQEIPPLSLLEAETVAKLEHGLKLNNADSIRLSRLRKRLCRR